MTSHCEVLSESQTMTNPPKINGHRIIGEIGKGATGCVYEARNELGEECAIKVFEAVCSNVMLLESRISRVYDGEVFDVTVPIQAKALESRPACLVMPLMAERIQGEIAPKTLQRHFSDYQGTELTWPFLIKLASRLAQLHQAKVAHGNLKPGNIFLGANGGPLLADYTTGLMPDIQLLEYSDALLYSPPEQLRNPAGYLDEAGYRWDVFAFGVLSFQLLTGKFPRCDSLFSGVSSTSGAQEPFQVKADYEGIANGLESEPGFMWPSESSNDVEARRREIINYCLSLDPMGRPGDLREVSRRFEAIDEEVLNLENQLQLEKRRARAERRYRRVIRYALGVSLLSVILGLGWVTTNQRRFLEKKRSEQVMSAQGRKAQVREAQLVKEKDEALSIKATSLEDQKRVIDLLSEQRQESREEIRSLLLTNEVLFSSILEGDFLAMPVLGDRKSQLSQLLALIDQQLGGLKQDSKLDFQRSLLQMRKAEICFSLGEFEEGARVADEAISSERLTKQQLAEIRLKILIAQSLADISILPERIGEDSSLFAEVWKENEPEGLLAAAAVCVAEGRFLEYRGQIMPALDRYRESLAKYRLLKEQFPQPGRLEFAIRSSQLAASRVLEQEGLVGESSDLRNRVINDLETLLLKFDQVEPELSYEIASAKAEKAVSLWQQGRVIRAEQLAQENLAHLLKLEDKLGEQDRFIVDLVSQQAIIASSKRDEGDADEALLILLSGINRLEGGLEENAGCGQMFFLLQSLKWQQAGILGQRGQSEDELRIGEEVRAQLRTLLKKESFNPSPWTVRKSLAYLCSELADVCDLQGQRELAITYLKEAQTHWLTLQEMNETNAEVREGSQWVSERLRELGAQ